MPAGPSGWAEKWMLVVGTESLSWAQPADSPRKGGVSGRGGCGGRGVWGTVGAYPQHEPRTT